ncbi:282_t:CDS:2 [Ambispora gerdemannii]|uniref:282_t:CDS:1 n=1 Tax=Ambispora gerdemannii TaxID=144530 RepID=A0A9N9C4P5_9GLOM|nr:282_t:CDS:2 [Ambispora gerdemannii]
MLANIGDEHVSIIHAFQHQELTIQTETDRIQELFEVIAEYAKNISSLEILLKNASAPFLQTITSLQNLQLLIPRSIFFELLDSLSDDFWIELSKQWIQI